MFLTSLNVIPIVKVVRILGYDYLPEIAWNNRIPRVHENPDCLSALVDLSFRSFGEC